MKILHEGNFNTPKVFEENNKYFIEYNSGFTGKKEIKRIPVQCCRTCANSKDYTGLQCPYTVPELICKDNLDDIDNGYEKLEASGLDLEDYKTESCWELYQGETIKGY